MASPRLNTQRNDDFFASIWDELMWRGLVKVSTDETELRRILSGDPITFYCGFDPTAPSLHVGNLVQILLMRRLQLAGHNPLGLVGGSTGLIGDPRPTAERTLNDREVVEGWVVKLQNQLGSFLADDGDNPLRLVNNLDWFGELSALDFLRNLGKFFRVNTMLKKDAVRSRLESDAGISFTEFSYQILQASDFLELHQNEECVLQTGGSDQWGNLIGGVELIGRVTRESVHALGTPLITNTDGTKFGKSEGNAIWLDPSMTSPFEFFQFWLNTADADVVSRLKVFTFLSAEEIGEIETSVIERPFARAAQKQLAFEVTALVHGEEVARDIEQLSSVLFGGSGSLQDVSETSLRSALEAVGVAEAEIGEPFEAVAVRAGLCETLSEARRLIKQNGLSSNNRKVASGETVSSTDFVHDSLMVLRQGKRHIAGVVLR